MAKTQAAVTEKVQELERKRDAGQLSKASRKKMTVAGWAEIWLTEVAPRTASESTIESVYRPRLSTGCCHVLSVTSWRDSIPNT